MCRCTRLGGDDDTALRIAHQQWRTNVLPSPLLADLELTEQFEWRPHHVRPEDVGSAIIVSSDPSHYVAVCERPWSSAWTDCSCTMSVRTRTVHRRLRREGAAGVAS